MVDEKLEIFYGIDFDVYEPGDFDHIPNNVVAARIVHSFSNIENGEVLNGQEIYRFFIGKVYSVNDLLNYKLDYWTTDILEKHWDNSVHYVVVPNGKKIEDKYFYTFDVNRDKVFNNVDSFKEAIQSINCDNINQKDSVKSRKLQLNNDITK